MKREDPANDLKTLGEDLRRMKPEGWSVVLGAYEIIVRPKDRTAGKFSITLREECCVMFFSRELNIWNKSRYFEIDVSLAASIKAWMESEAAEPLKRVKSNWRKQMRLDIGEREIDGDDYFAVIQPVFLSVSIYDGPERYEEDLSNFSTEQRLVLAYHWYLSEVNNGGHEQFYCNSTGIVWPDALKGFREIGHAEVAAIIQTSVSRLGGAPSLNREEREEQLEQMDASFEDLDQELFELLDQPDFDEKVLEFIRKHRQKFLFSGVVNEP